MHALSMLPSAWLFPTSQISNILKEVLQTEKLELSRKKMDPARG